MFIVYPLSIKNYFKSIQHKPRQETKHLLNEDIQEIYCALLGVGREAWMVYYGGRVGVGVGRSGRKIEVN